MLAADAVVDNFAQAIFVAVKPIRAPTGTPPREATGIPSGRGMGFDARRQAIGKGHDLVGRSDVAKSEHVDGFVSLGSDLR